MSPELNEKKSFRRVQTGLRLERRTLKVLKALAEYLDVTLGDLVQEIILCSFEGAHPFGDATLEKIERLRDIYGLELEACPFYSLEDKVADEPAGE